MGFLGETGEVIGGVFAGALEAIAGGPGMVIIGGVLAYKYRENIKKWLNIEGKKKAEKEK